MGIKCIALDLDRTTLDARGRLSEKNKEALEEAARRGIQIVVASGRALSTLPEDIVALKGVRYAITSNGAAVYDMERGECLKQYKMSRESVEQVLACTRDCPVSYEAFVDGKAYASGAYVEDPVSFGASSRAVGYIQGTRIPVEDIVSFIGANAGRLDSMDIVVGSQEEKARLWKILSEKVSDVYITSSVPQLLELSYKESGKHTGAAFLLDYLGIGREELAAFGDGDNDAELLAFAGLGIAVENASSACLAAADYVTLAHDKDGVAQGIWNIMDENTER